MRAPQSNLPQSTADILARIRARAPRVHCITNTVAQAFTANVLLAVGVVPSMTIAPEEIAAFVAGADALLVNLGTFDAERRSAIDIAVGQASGGIPWVLDPVFIDRSPARAEYARGLVAHAPAAVRLNAPEFGALAGMSPETEPLASYAREHGAIIALTGATDVVTDGTRRAQIGNGHALMGRVTAMGCAGSALVAACLAVEPDSWIATAASVLALGVAGEMAAEHARGPGSLSMDILDALYALEKNALLQRAQVT
jgi:hydroxyethylthiazole kinase